MTEKGYKDGLVSWVRNSASNKKYVVSTAEEIGKDYWSSTVLPVIFGIFPNFFKPKLAVIRNNKEDAHEAHAWIKEIITKYPEATWYQMLPQPKPPEGWSPGAARKIKDLGIDTD
jgi:hypothetical protein